MKQRQEHPDPLAGHQRQQLRAHRALASTLACVSIAPLGLPVVPDVYISVGQVVGAPAARRDFAAVTGQRLERQVAALVRRDHVAQLRQLRRRATAGDRGGPVLSVTTATACE